MPNFAFVFADNETDYFGVMRGWRWMAPANATYSSVVNHNGAVLGCLYDPMCKAAGSDSTNFFGYNTAFSPSRVDLVQNPANYAYTIRGAL